MMFLLLACSSNAEFKAGDYQFYTVDMVDDCLDGALEALFMPEGRMTPHEFEYPIYVPSLEELPTSYEISLREPFVGMPITVTAQGSSLQFEGGVMEEVLVNENLYGDCVSTMTADASIAPTSKYSGIGDASIEISDWRGDEGRCPEPDADPCLVTLELELEHL
jgi:hypothetical protein